MASRLFSFLFFISSSSYQESLFECKWVIMSVDFVLTFGFMIGSLIRAQKISLVCCVLICYISDSPLQIITR
ncbi:hypothetical protein DFH11DRAFT_1614490, partial [Phellopilus nigrolimitatus]